MEHQHDQQPPLDAPEPVSQSPKQTEVKPKALQFSTEGMPNVIAKKVASVVDILNQEVVDLQALKRRLAEGIPDEAAVIREYSWKIILGYLPQQRSKWPATEEKQSQTYQSLVKMFLPQQKFPQYPLWLRKGHPRLAELQPDYLLWQQIEKDTSRTHAQFSFFSTPSSPIMLPYLTSARRQKFKLINGDDDISYKEFLSDKEKQRKTYRYDYMTRILYIYAKLNPKIQYVQGMNQILAPIFYLVNVTRAACEVEEASCFFMFNNAICDIIELHIKDFDKSKNGIHGKLGEVSDMLIAVEPQIWKRMEQLKIDPFFYCFRWITLLYAQDFALFDTLRIWQFIFSTDNRVQHTKFFAIAILISCRQFILQNQFTVVLEHLQDIKDHIVINHVIDITKELLREYGECDIGAIAEKGKKRVQKVWDKERKEEERVVRREERVREKERLRGQRERAEQKEEEEDKEQPKEGEEEKEEKTMGKKVQKQLGGLFRKVGNAFDKFIK